MSKPQATEGWDSQNNGNGWDHCDEQKNKHKSKEKSPKSSKK